MGELLDDSNLKYWAYRNEFYKEENKKLSEILELIFLNTQGKGELMELMLPHAFKAYRRVVVHERRRRGQET